MLVVKKSGVGIPGLFESLASIGSFMYREKPELTMQSTHEAANNGCICVSVASQRQDIADCLLIRALQPHMPVAVAEWMRLTDSVVDYIDSSIYCIT
jgi:hypothetical protein